MSFQPNPIIPPEKPTNDGRRFVIIVQPCGYCNQWFHCFDIAITSCKHTFHPFCFCAMLQNSNKCCVCKQKLHPNWWSSWGICETYEDMKTNSKDMHIHELHKDMVVGVFEVAKSRLDLKTFGEWRSKYFNLKTSIEIFS